MQPAAQTTHREMGMELKSSNQHAIDNTNFTLLTRKYEHKLFLYVTQDVTNLFSAMQNVNSQPEISLVPVP